MFVLAGGMGSVDRSDRADRELMVVAVDMMLSLPDERELVVEMDKRAL